MAAARPPRGLRGAELELLLSRNQPRRELVPTGILEVGIVKEAYVGVRTIWRDGKRKRLEEQLDKVVAHFDVAANAINRQREERLRTQREYEERARRRVEEEQRRRDEAERAERLEGEARRWRLANDIRQYVAEVRKTVATAGVEIWDVPQLEAWAAWAEDYATRIDPLRAGATRWRRSAGDD